MSGRFFKKVAAIALMTTASLVGSQAWSAVSAEFDPDQDAIPTEGSSETVQPSAAPGSAPPAAPPETAESTVVQDTAPLAATPAEAEESASQLSSEPEYPELPLGEESDQAAKPTSMADTTKTEEVGAPDTGKQDSPAEATTATRPVYPWGKRRGFGGYHHEFADRQRERRRAWRAQMKESRDRYQAVRRWWSNPRSEARRKWAYAQRQYMRDQSEQMRAQRFAYDDQRLDEVSPGMAPYVGTPYGPGSFGTPPAWGAPPRF